MIAAGFNALFWALVLALCVPGLAGRPSRAAAVLAAALIALNVPLAGVTPLAVLRGVFATPAVTTLVLVAALFAARAARVSPFARREGLQLAMFAALTGLAFYPPALGLGPVDPYAWGYGGAVLALAAGALGVLCAASGRWLSAIALSLAIVAWRLRLLESPNLWDYLVDPLLALGGLAWLGVGVACWPGRRAQS